jgi:hypothetical protein
VVGELAKWVETGSLVDPLGVLGVYEVVDYPDDIGSKLL